jgi:hypothetical protein
MLNSGEIAPVPIREDTRGINMIQKLSKAIPVTGNGGL